MRNAQFRVNIDRPDAFGGFNTPRCGNAVRSHNRPQADIFRSYAVGVVLVVALLAAEAQPFAIGRRDVTTPGQPLDVFFGLTISVSMPTAAALYATKNCPCAYGQRWTLERSSFPLLNELSLMFVKFSKQSVLAPFSTA